MNDEIVRDNMDRSDLQELLATLYLRLNGYFTSGFIAHAPENNLTEVDILAVRFPYNSEPEREVEPSGYLQIPDDRIDLLLCEVKGGRESLQFNRAMRNNLDGVAKVLHWAGMFDENDLESLIPEVYEAIQTKEINTPEKFIEVAVGDCHLIRGVFFGPDRPAPKHNQARYVFGQEIVDFIFKCLCPKEQREDCGTRYNFGQWGIYRDLVTYFKSQTERGTIENVYKHFGV
jgi:hypothetical protein